MMNKLDRLRPDGIIVPFDRPPPDPAAVAVLKISMAEIGLLNPISIQRASIMGQPVLAAGRNRLQAAIELKWETIDVIELPRLDGPEDAETIAKLAEIAENLHRREITALERSELQAAWIEIVQARKENAADKPAPVEQVSRELRGKPKSGRPSGGIEQAARELGVPATNLRQSVKISKLAPEAKTAARTHGLDDNQDALLEAAKAKTPQAQTAAIERRAQQEAPKPKSSGDTGGLRGLKAAWAKASQTDREAFLEWIKE